jgi:hypothetical protein
MAVHGGIPYPTAYPLPVVDDYLPRFSPYYYNEPAIERSYCLPIPEEDEVEEVEEDAKSVDSGIAGPDLAPTVTTVVTSWFTKLTAKKVRKSKTYVSKQLLFNSFCSLKFGLETR